MLVNLASAISVILTFAALLVNVKIPVRPAWLPWLLWIAAFVSFLLLLLLAFVANYRYHVRTITKLDSGRDSELRGLRDDIVSLKDERRTLQHDLDNERKENSFQRNQKEILDGKASQYETERNRLQTELKEQAITHQAEIEKLQALMEAKYQEYHEKLISHLKEVNDLKGQVFAERSKNATPNIYGKIKELYVTSRSAGLFVTLHAMIGNKGADTTLQPFRLKYSFNGRVYEGRLEDVTVFCVHRKIDKPLWPSGIKEDERVELSDLSEDQLKPLERFRFREGWLRFRFPQLAYERPNPELTLEITDAADTVCAITIAPPWPQNGTIRYTKDLDAEWQEAIERSQQQEAEESGE